MHNRASQLIQKVNRLPGPVRRAVLSHGLGAFIKIFGTAGIKVVSISDEKVELYLPNHKKIRNHFGTIAAAMAILHAETASGIIMGMNVQEHCLPVLKSVQFNFPKRMQGGLTATAWLTEAQRGLIATSDKGELVVETRVVDETGMEPVNGQFIWAWIPRR